MEAMAALAAEELPVRKKTQVTPRPWERQPADTDLWWYRFLPYLALGPKRSVSLVAMGRRNAYPIPAHWPIQAQQLNWRARAEAFDKACQKDPELIAALNSLLQSSSAAILKAMRNKSAANVNPREFVKQVLKEGYKMAPPEDEYEEPAPRAVREVLEEPEPIFPIRPLTSEG